VDLSGLNLNLMVALDALLTERHVGRAAKRVGVTQSAMSHNLRQLRELLGDPLLVRSGNQMMPTPRATALAPGLRDGLRTLERVLHTPETPDPSGFTRTFVLAVADTIASIVLELALPRLRREAPKASLQIVPQGGAEMAGPLARGDMDVAFMLPFDVPPGLIAKSIPGGGWSVAGRADHPALQAPIDVETYAALPHVVTTFSGGPTPVDHGLAKHGLTRHIAVRVPYNLAVPAALVSSDAITTLPTAAIRHHAEKWALAMQPAPLPMPPASSALAWHERYDNDPAHRWFRELILKDVVPEMSRRHPE
jgi:DNA-binding transcriptional LysR family regulator